MQKSSSMTTISGQQALESLRSADIRQQQYTPSTADVAEGVVTINTSEVVLVDRLTRSGESYKAPYVQVRDSLGNERIVALSSFRARGAYTLADGSTINANNLVGEYDTYEQIWQRLGQVELTLHRAYGLKFGARGPKTFEYWTFEEIQQQQTEQSTGRRRR